MKRGRLWVGDVRTSLGFAFEASTRLALATLVFLPLSLASQFAGAVALKLVIEGAVTGSRGRAVAGALIGAAALSTAVVWLPIGGGISARLQQRIGMIIDRRIMTLVAAVPTLEVHERPEYLSQLQLLLRDRFSLSAVVPVVASTVVLLILTVLVALVLALQAPLLVLLPLLALPSLWLGIRAERVWREANDATAGDWRLSQAMLNLATNAPAGKDVRLFALADELQGRHQRAAEIVRRAKWRASWKEALLTGAGWTVFVAAYIGAVLLVVRRSIDGQASPGDVIFTVSIAAPITSIAGQSAQYLRRLTELTTAAGRFRWLAELSASASRPPADPALVPDSASDGITLSGVSFGYPTGDGPALADVSLHLPAGKVVALIGENGAGKSTLVKLLCRLYEPTTGTITLDDVDLRRFDVADWRSKISVGFQDYCRYEVLVREAIGVGDITRIDDSGAVHAALARAGGTDMVDALSAGLETQLGTSWDGGVDLSTGQWQKLALGRALMSDPDIAAGDG